MRQNTFVYISYVTNRIQNNNFRLWILRNSLMNEMYKLTLCTIKMWEIECTDWYFKIEREDKREMA